MVKVFYSDISNLNDNIDYEEFCPARKLYINSFSNSLRRKQSIYVWKLLLKVLELNKISFNGFFVENNKWGLAQSQYHFSLSHSNNIVAVALSDKEVGVDVEMFSEKLLKVCKRLFPRQKIPKNKTENTFFGELWAKKECQVKNKQQNQLFSSHTVTDLLNNKYILGVISQDKICLEKNDLG